MTAVTLKSGTNQFKGSATLGGYTDATIAKNFFSGTKAPTKIVGYTFTLGGPIATEPDVLLRRLSAGHRQRRARAAFDHSADGIQERRLQPGLDDRVQPVHRHGKRHGTSAVCRQRHSRVDDQPDRAAHSRAHSRAEHRRRRARSDQLSSYRISERRRPTRSTSRSTIRCRTATRFRDASVISVRRSSDPGHLWDLRRRGKGLCGHRNEPDDQHRRDLDAHLEHDAGPGNSRRRQLLPQRSAHRCRTREDLRRARHQRA